MLLSPRWIVTLVILILVTGSAAAQETLDYGETVSGTLDDDNFEDRWTFTGQRGDRITLVMERTEDTPGGLDGYMLLVGPDGETLEEIDDTGSDIMPSLIDYELPADGNYTVVATRFGFLNGFSTGSYTLSLSQASDDAPEGSGAQWIDEASLPADLRALRYNERNIGTIVNEDYEDWFMFRGNSGDVISIRMTADNNDLDPYLILLDSNGVELASNDDADDDTTDAAIIDFELSAEGNYLIRATRYGYNNGPSSGDYNISIETDAAASPSSGDDTETAQQLAYGETAGGTLDLDSLHDLYRFTGREGQIITVAVRRTTGDLNPALSLRGPDQDEIALNRDLGNPSEAGIVHVTLPQNGRYTIDVMLEDLNTSGEYQVLLLLGADEDIDSDWEPTENTDLEFVLSWDSEVDLDLSVTSPADETISLSDPAEENGGELVSSANDFCTSLAPQPNELITWKTAQPGLYQIAVTYQFNCEGVSDPVPFTLTVVNQGEIVTVITGALAREGDIYMTTFTPVP